MNKTEALNIVVSLSQPSKMPCHGYSLPAVECKIGSELRKVPGSVCHGCYALKGNYTRFPAIQRTLYDRLAAIHDPRWEEAMIFLLKEMPYFRWFDSGDLQDESLLIKILNIAEGTPKTKHWLPTREYKIVEDVLKYRKLPDNLTIRLSAHMIDKPGPIELAKRLNVQISEVGTTKYTCPAPEQGNECKNCRKCWDTKQFNIIYHKH